MPGIGHVLGAALALLADPLCDEASLDHESWVFEAEYPLLYISSPFLLIMSTSSSPHEPTLYKDDSDASNILLILNSDPSQLAPSTTPQPPSITAHRFRQILIVPDASDVETEHISLMPLLTYTTERNGSTTCRPQVVARLRRLDTESTTGETDLIARFLQVWSDTPERRSTTTKADSAGDIVAAIQNVELLAARVGQMYSEEATIYDSDNAADQDAFKGEWYGALRYLRCTSTKTFALTVLTRPVGIISGNRVKYLDILYTVSEVETQTAKVHTSSRFTFSSVGQKVLFPYVQGSRRSASATIALKCVVGCHADIDVVGASGSAAMRERDRSSEEPSAEERGPLYVPLNRLNETFDTLHNLFMKETRQVVDIGVPIFDDALKEAGKPTLDAITVIRPQLRPANLFQLRDSDSLEYLTDKTLSFSIV